MRDPFSPYDAGSSPPPPWWRFARPGESPTPVPTPDPAAPSFRAETSGGAAEPTTDSQPGLPLTGMSLEQLIGMYSEGEQLIHRLEKRCDMLREILVESERMRARALARRDVLAIHMRRAAQSETGQ